MKRYETSFKEMVVELLNSGQSLSNVSKDYGVNKITLRNWQKKFNSPGGLSGKKVLTAEQEEIKRLKKALRDAEMERDILKKAVSIFSKKD